MKFPNSGTDMLKLRRVIWCVILWLSANVQAEGSGSVLDLDTIAQASITKDVSISPKNPSITRTSGSRSIVECVIGCMKLYPFGCTSVFRDKTTGKCYEMNGTVAEVLIPFSSYTPVGHLIELVKKGENSNCNGRACNDGEVCLKDSLNKEQGSHICLGDQTGKCDINREYNNLRHYWSSEIKSRQDTGVVMSATYPKKIADSGMRVIIHMPVRAHRDDPYGCNNWYITFNGIKCDNPANIEYLDFSADTGNYHQNLDIDGTCYGLEAGIVRVEFVVGLCNGSESLNACSGWNGVRSMMVMEMLPLPALKAGVSTQCPLLNTFNYRYHTWIDELTPIVKQNSEHFLIKSISYEKMANETCLRIKYSAVAGVLAPNSAQLSHCGRWYVKINGAECSPRLDFVIVPHKEDHGGYFTDHRRTRTAEGICENTLSIGKHSLEIWVSACEDSIFEQSSTLVSGWLNSPSRLHVEEVRQKRAIDAVKSRNGMYKSHVGKLQNYNWWMQSWQINSSAEIVEITYYKEFNNTALRMTASGSHKLRRSTTNSIGRCATWYFKIDGIVCTNPGRIYGMTYFDRPLDYNNPMQVSGVCYAVLAGNHTITYSVGRCLAMDHPQTTTGAMASFTIIVEELRLDQTKTCTETCPDCEVNVADCDAN